jgi:hypothetical protein
MQSPGEFLPKIPEEFPDASGVMESGLREGRFRDAAHNLLLGVININRITETPSGWQVLRQSEPIFKTLHHSSILNRELRVGVVSAVNHENFGDMDEWVVNAAIRYFADSEPIDLTNSSDDDSEEHLIIEGHHVSTMYVRGVVGGEGAPDFVRGGDCEPELQDLSLRVEGHPSGSTTVCHDAGVRYEFTIPEDVHYAFFDQPPRGNEEIIEVMSKMALFFDSLT